MYDSTSLSLLQRVSSNEDQEAWKRFVDLYTPLICYWGQRAGLDENDAVDLAQEVLLLLTRKIRELEYDAGKSFRGWLRTVTLNKWREKKRRSMLPIDSAPDAVDRISVPNDVNDFWEHEYRQHLAARALTLMKDSFQPTTWKACWQIVFEGRTPAEVAEDLNLSVGAVYAAKCRVLRRLKDELDGMLD